MLKYIIKLLKALNSNRHPGEIAHAVCCALVLGFMPKSNLTWYIVTFLFLFLRINKAALALLTIAFSFLAPVFDPLFGKLGYAILTWQPVAAFMEEALEFPGFHFLKLNNTIVIGSFVSSLVLYLPVYGLARLFIFVWRRYLVPALRKTKFVQAVSKMPLVLKLKGLV